MATTRVPTTERQVREFNLSFYAMLEDPSMQKQAADSINEFTRLTIREEGFMRKILPPLDLPDDELSDMLDTDSPVKIVEKESNLPPAISVGYGGLPNNFYIEPNKYAVTFRRIISPRVNKDMSELRTYKMDIRQVIADNMAKDILAEEDRSGINAVNVSLIGSGSTVPSVGTSLYRSISGGISRESIQDMLNIMPSSQYNIQTETVLTNNLTIREFAKWRRDEVGGDLAESVLRQGWTEATAFGVNWLVTIKRDLVATNTMYLFGPPSHLGKSFILEKPTMYIKREFWQLSYFMWEELGSTFGNIASLGRCDFTS